MKKFIFLIIAALSAVVFNNFSYENLTPNVISILNPKVISDSNIMSEKLAALTFDDGPDDKYTSDILDILKKYNVKATFFVVGENIEKNHDLLIRELNEGHEIANHTYTHPDLKGCGELQIVSEILSTGETIKKITNKTPMYFRPPKGIFTKETVAIADLYGYKTVLWNICVEHRESKTVKAMAQRILDKAKPGIIILAHDGRLDRTKTVKAIPLIIEGYKKKGYTFVTLDELLNYKEN